MPAVGIVMGSDSDLPVMQEAVATLERMGIECEVAIISAHRTPARAEEYARTAAERGLRVIIAAAGGAAHLAGVLAAWTPLPVIGVPIRTEGLGGLDSLLSMVQMPAGVPVAVVSINGARNAAILAAQILGVFDLSVRQQVIDMKETQRKEVEARAARLQEIGVEAYLLGQNQERQVKTAG